MIYVYNALIRSAMIYVYNVLIRSVMIYMHRDMIYVHSTLIRSAMIYVYNALIRSAMIYVYNVLIRSVMIYMHRDMIYVHSTLIRSAMISDSFTILGLWVGPETRCFPYQWVQLQTYESKTLVFMTSLQYHCILGLAEMKTLHRREKIMLKRCRLCR